METILAICTIIGTIIAIFQFSKQRSQPNELRDTLLATYLTSQKLILKLIEDLKNYAVINNAHNEFFTGTITIQGYIQYLEEMYSKELSDQLFSELKAMTLTDSNMQLMQSNLDKQISSFNQSQAYFDTSFRLRQK
ncbi:hypothetical protein [Niabella hibiscisoli]|uniref:hypothetical protein n=1 Tax=Niabella hibiscisoli TaxID=1825928 RepID=UPI001F0D7FFA|nr:hypothetical protein [Niabella hibiscisoli]MCH5720182.1 hypothetical protein [Niabella hibiscisoli]